MCNIYAKYVWKADLNVNVKKLRNTFAERLIKFQIKFHEREKKQDSFFRASAHLRCSM